MYEGSAPTYSTIMGNELFKKLSTFKYIGSTLTEDSRCESEIKQRIWIAGNAFLKIRIVVSSRHIREARRIRLNKT